LFAKHNGTRPLAKKRHSISPNIWQYQNYHLQAENCAPFAKSVRRLPNASSCSREKVKQNVGEINPSSQSYKILNSSFLARPLI